jgi:hypothetical protein
MVFVYVLGYLWKSNCCADLVSKDFPMCQFIVDGRSSSAGACRGDLI